MANESMDPLAIFVLTSMRIFTMILLTLCFCHHCESKLSLEVLLFEDDPGQLSEKATASQKSVQQCMDTLFFVTGHRTSISYL